MVLEATRGDPEAARRRLERLEEIPNLEISEAAATLAAALIENGALPENAADDAMHLAIAAVHHVDFLLTWNCRDIANAERKPTIRRVCAEHGLRCPEICTPQELMGDFSDA